MSLKVEYSEGIYTALFTLNTNQFDEKDREILNKFLDFCHGWFDDKPVEHVLSKQLDLDIDTDINGSTAGMVDLKGDTQAWPTGDKR